jgi:hypothetical protein
MVRTVRIGDAEVPDKSGESPGSAIWHQLLWRQSKAAWQYYQSTGAKPCAKNVASAEGEKNEKQKTPLVEPLIAD